LGLADHAAYAERFIGHVLERHFDPATGLMRNVPGQDACNVGHGIEFVGFALDWLGADADSGLAATLERVLVASFRAGFVGPGITLSVSAATGQAQSQHCPWWSLPETIRAAALCHQRTGSADTLDVWRRADAAFFGSYWRGEPPIAYQTLTAAGPVDFVPATPDLDPGYHTGLSLLAAIHAADALAQSATIQKAAG
jgi:mannose/cellobiose epimerase-like protein (N-acyl-D-glucosamine 2-epimerase family)